MFADGVDIMHALHVGFACAPVCNVCVGGVVVSSMCVHTCIIYIEHPAGCGIDSSHATRIGMSNGAACGCDGYVFHGYVRTVHALTHESHWTSNPLKDYCFECS